MDTEEYFPRGNLNAIKKKPHTTNQIENDSLIFDTLKRKQSGSESKRPQFESHKKLKASNDVNVVDLNYETVKKGMTLLACIRAITNHGIEVELPGRLCGKINIAEVSDPFTKLIENKINNCGASDDETAVQMDEIFKIGHFLPTRVTEKYCLKKMTNLKLSANPTNIHNDWSYMSFIKGRLVWAAVQTLLEHGYQLCVGKDNCRIFLPFRNVQEGLKYVVGQPLWCVVKKSTIVSDISTVIVSTLEKHVNSRSGNFDLLKLIPGTQVNFTINNIVKSGVVGTFEKHTACIHAAFLKVPYEDVGNYKEGDNFKAFLLYVDPVSSIAYLSMRGLSCAPPKFSNGTVLYSEVVKVVNRGLQIRLPNASTGLIPAKRIRLSPESLKEMYPSGSQHNCQILDYRRLEQLYICTLQILTGKKSNDVTIGQLVEVKVVKIEKAGLVVQVDKITGFIANFHLSDAPYVESVKKEFNVGQMLKARIWNITERGVNLTCKPFLVNSDICFSSLKDVVIGKPYPGVVAKKNRNELLVVFYGDVRGMLPSNHVCEVFGADFLNVLYVGEVIMPIIHGIKDNFLLLKVNNPGVPNRTVENTTVNSKNSPKRTKKLSSINETNYTHLGKEELVKVEERKSPEQETAIVANQSSSKKNKNVEKLGSAKRRKIAEPEEMDIKEEADKSSSKRSKKLSTINKTKDAQLRKEELEGAEKKKSSEQETTTVTNKNSTRIIKSVKKLGAADRTKISEPQENEIKEADGKCFSQLSKKLSTINKTKNALLRKEELVEAEEKKSSEQQTKTVTNKSSPKKKKSVKESEAANRTKISKPEEMEIKEDDTSDDENIFNLTATDNNMVALPKPRLPGVYDFFSQNEELHSHSSSEEDTPKVKSPVKKKKLTVAERTELIRQTEEKIRAKEIELADANIEPQSEEQFERVIAGNPNSSKLWAKYVAFCISNAEIHKARTIAKSALKRIDLNETDERYNIWITLLHLENNYGDKESFHSVFEEAVRCNDDLQIYLDVINLLAESEKYKEMNDKIKKVIDKHKTDPKMWINVARAYYKCGHLQQARNIHNSALKAIERKTTHVDVVVQFAIMEYTYGAKHHAEALFETVLQSNPKRVDIWSAYVDQMVKKNNIDGARRIFERAVCQCIPAKKMKTLFKKYKEMEVKHGNEEGVQHVVDLATRFIGNEVK